MAADVYGSNWRGVNIKGMGRFFILAVADLDAFVAVITWRNVSAALIPV